MPRYIGPAWSRPKNAQECCPRFAATGYRRRKRDRSARRPSQRSIGVKERGGARFVGRARRLRSSCRRRCDRSACSQVRALPRVRVGRGRRHFFRRSRRTRARTAIRRHTRDGRGECGRRCGVAAAATAAGRRRRRDAMVIVVRPTTGFHEKFRNFLSPIVSRASSPPAPATIWRGSVRTRLSVCAPPRGHEPRALSSSMVGWDGRGGGGGWALADTQSATMER